MLPLVQQETSTVWGRVSSSNDHISVIGRQLSAVLDQLENIEGGKMTPEEKTDLKLNVVVRPRCTVGYYRP